jgi:hypothetical protein
MAATAAMTVIVLLLNNFAVPTPVDSPLVRLVLLSTAGAVTYCVVLLAIGSPAISEAVEVAGWILRRYRASN